MKPGYLRFLGLLTSISVLSLLVGTTLLGWSVRSWKSGQGEHLRPLAVEIAKNLGDLDFKGLREHPEAVKEATRRRLESLRAVHWPHKGPSLALFDIRPGRKEPYLSLWVGTGVTYANPPTGTEPEGPPTAAVQQAIRGEVSMGFSEADGGEVDETPQITVYAPVRSPEGKVEGVLAVDRDLVLGDQDLYGVVRVAAPWIILLALTSAATFAWLFRHQFIEPDQLLHDLHEWGVFNSPRYVEQPTLEPTTHDQATSPPPSNLHTPDGGGIEPASPGLPPAPIVAPEASFAIPAPGVSPVPHVVLDIRPGWELCTPREKQVLAYLPQGLKNKAIANILIKQPGTVKKQLTNAFAKIFPEGSDLLKESEESKRTIVAFALAVQIPQHELEEARSLD